jgi:hypothetical protein
MQIVTLPTGPSGNSCVHNQSHNLTVRTLCLPGQDRHVWIVVTGTGEIDLAYTLVRLQYLQTILDSIAKSKRFDEFTFLFDFKHLTDFVDMATIRQFGKFMEHNHDLFVAKLTKSHVLLRRTIWRLVLNALLLFRKPVKQVLVDSIDPDIYAALA